jgi:hypothetical protein
MLITDSYRDLNAKLHDHNPGYGRGGWTWIGPLLHFMRAADATDLIDYGAGKGTLARWMPPEYTVVNYDPVTYPDLPEPADFVVSLDVLEHIEPECLDAVLDHIRALTKKAAFLLIATREARKVLEDGRNAHLIVQPADWWFHRVNLRFPHVEQIDVGVEGVVALSCRV